MTRLVTKSATKLDPDMSGKLHDLVEAAIKKDKNYFELCRNVRKWLAGDHWHGWPTDDKSMARLTVNLMHAHARSLLPTVFFREPYVEAYPNNQLNQHESAAHWEGLLNHLNERNGYKKETKMVALDAIVYPQGWKKWTFTKAADDEDIETGEAPLPKGGLEAASGALAEGGKEGPYQEFTLNSAVGLRLSPEQVITDSKNRTLEGSRFVAVRYQKLLSEIVADPRYDLTAEQAAQLERPSTSKAASSMWGLWDDPHSPSKTVITDGDVPVTLYEIWVYQLVDFKLYKQVVVMLKEMPERPIRGPVPWSEFVGRYVHTYPFNVLEFNPVPDAQPVSELAVFRSMQQSVNWLTSRITSMVETQKQFYNFNPEAAKNPEKAKLQLESNKVVEFIESKEPGTPVIDPVVHNRVPTDNYQLLQTTLGLLQQVTGLSQNRKGSSGIRTAREAMIIEQGAQIKTDEKVDTMSDFCQRDMEILTRMVRHVSRGDFLFFLRGAVGPQKWGQFTQEDAGWSPDVRIRVNSFRKIQAQERIQDYQFLLQAGAQLFPIYNQKLRLDVLYRRMLDESEIPNPHEVMDSVIPDEIFQMSEIVALTNGMAAPVDISHPHKLHLAILTDFMSSPIFQNLPPEAQDAVVQHHAEHMAFEQQLSAQAPQFADNSNAFNQGGGGLTDSAEGGPISDRSPQPLAGQAGGV